MKARCRVESWTVEGVREKDTLVGVWNSEVKIESNIKLKWS